MTPHILDSISCLSTLEQYFEDESLWKSNFVDLLVSRRLFHISK